MREKTKRRIIFCGYCLPYAFFGVYGDAVKDSILFYVMMFAVTGGLAAAAEVSHNIKTALAGNAVSTAVSYVCALAFVNERWSWYFKPFRATELVLLIAALALCGQLVVWSEMKRMRRKKEAES